ncbi:hypothetical protein [Halomarina pelagica]|uniref:hypothetical protein n=1 Tax=Halomarina pelagica TaxID=2961599 RepID=UPI0020C55BCC|nr:hypothetical protein [Halomarina sp. BND7]
MGVDDVTLEEFTFTRWEPTDWSLILDPTDDSAPLPVAGYIPYSGTTGPKGHDAPVTYLPGLSNDGTTVVLDGVPIGEAISAYDVADKIVVVDVPLPEISLSSLREQFYFVNDSIPETLAPTLFTGLLAVPQIHAALETQNAAGMVGILPFGPDAANNLYAPFEGVVADLPGLYVDQFTGRQLKQELATAGGTLPGRLRLEATVDEQATARNIVGVIPAPTDRELVLCTHTDGTNANEDNGPVAILALAEYFRQLPRGRRPVTIRVILTGGHFARHNAGLRAYLDDHKDEVKENVLAAIELEHLGALE